MVLFLHYKKTIDCYRSQFQLPSCDEHHKYLSAAWRKSDRYQFCTILCSCSSDPQGKHSPQEAPDRMLMYQWLPRGHCLLCSAPWRCGHPDPPASVSALHQSKGRRWAGTNAHPTLTLKAGSDHRVWQAGQHGGQSVASAGRAGRSKVRCDQPQKQANAWPDSGSNMQNTAWFTTVQQWKLSLAGSAKLTLNVNVHWLHFSAVAVTSSQLVVQILQSQLKGARGQVLSPLLPMRAFLAGFLGEDRSSLNKSLAAPVTFCPALPWPLF